MGFTSISPPSVVRQSSATLTNRIFTSAGGSGLELSRASDAFNSPRFRLGEGFYEFGGGGSSPPDTVIGRSPPLGLSASGYLVQNGLRFERLGWLNVKDFGAVGDGTTDDYAAIEATLDNAGLGAFPSVVYFPPGTYLSSNLINIRQNTIVLGSGIGNTTLRCASSVGNGSFIRNSNVGGSGDSNITIADLTIDPNGSNRASQTSTGHGMSLGSADGTVCNNLTLRNVELTNNKFAGIVCQNIKSLVIQGCHVHDIQRDGIAVYYNSSGVRIVNNYLHDCGDDFIALNGELTTTGTTGHALTDATVANNTLGPSPVLGPNAGIVCRGGKRIAITGNTIHQAESVGILLMGLTSQTLTDVTVSGNTIVEAGYTAASGGYGMQLTCTAWTSSNGVPPVERVTITGNVILRPRLEGIGVFLDQDGGLISEVSINGNVLVGYGATGGHAAGNGISIQFSTNSTVRRWNISNNIISEFANAGIRIDPASPGDVRLFSIHNNRVWSNGQQTTAPGIHVVDVSDVVITNNRCGDDGTVTQTYGVTVANLLGTNLIANNNLQGNATAGISRTALSAKTWIRDNVGRAAMPTVASAATIQINDEVVQITGTTTVTSITAGEIGAQASLQFTSTAQVTDGSNLKLAGNFTGGADRVLNLFCDGTNWIETGRSTN